MNALALFLMLATTLEGDWPAEEKRVTLSFERAPSDDVLRAIADAAKLSIVIHAERRFHVTASFRDTPAADAFRTVLETRGLRAVRRGNLIAIVDREDEDREDDDREDDDREDEDREDGEGDAGIKVKIGRHRHGDEGGGTPERVHVGGDVVVNEGQEVSEAVAVGGSVEVRGKAREAVAVGGDVRVLGRGEVTGDTVAIGGKVHVDPEAKVGGDRVEVGAGALPKIVLGLLGVGAAASLAWWLVHGVASFVVFFVVGWMLLGVAPRRLDAVGGALRARPLRSGLVGMLGAVATGLLCSLLIVSILGIPLLPLVVLAVVAAVVLGMAAVALLLGRALPIGRAKGDLLSLALGTLALVVVRHIPAIGGLVIWIVSLVAFGAVVLARGGQISPHGGETPAPPLATAA